MKSVQIIIEGAADEPVDSLQGHTPMEVARCTAAAKIAERGACGLLSLPHEGLDARNEVFLGEMLGLPKERALFLRRGPLEAVAALDEIQVDEDEWAAAYTGQFVTLDQEILRDCDVQGLSMEETRVLSASISTELLDGITIHAVAPNRVVVLARQEAAHAGYAPCLAEGEACRRTLPPQKEQSYVRQVFECSRNVLRHSQINDVRVDLGENPADALWIWGGGSIVGHRQVLEGARRSGLCMTSSRMACGMSSLMGMETLHFSVCDDGRMAFKLPDFVEMLQRHEKITVYVPSLHAGGVFKDASKKVQWLELIDQSLLRPLLEVLEAYAPWRVLLTADGVVSTEKQRPTSGMIPFVVAGDGMLNDACSLWNEKQASKGEYGRLRIRKLLELFGKEM